MRATPLSIPDLLLLEPTRHGDERGFFMESYNKARLDALLGADLDFVQDNHSRSSRGVLRGLHFQRAPRGQGKLVRVVAGAIWDVAVDIRPGSETFGRWAAAELSAENARQLWVPEGFAHGFLVLSDAAEVLYKTTDYYSPEMEGAVCWDDPAIGIEWPLEGEPILSGKDRQAPRLSDLGIG